MWHIVISSRLLSVATVLESRITSRLLLHDGLKELSSVTCVVKSGKIISCREQVGCEPHKNFLLYAD